ncbi:glutamine amidotransferase class-I [Arcobacter nitrofigilis DSM 7299]|uniref:Glutamine amidotransferase class-I n=1 Tax=Arcobacter nitrofigilis (strain ATCC 33309 / DSM 7299 / CCUG 15893 / LMG 7604 / NCTC 12251 / CI) TaxID=572480 RepID=D5V5A5_ARCNC|nr:glutamine amidotransferase [Arcobacter nitrofigilis]ADG93040.1 glutamine amidotransferase class-I [Arcobacter nitrofigilis DSM 7299]
MKKLFIIKAGITFADTKKENKDFDTWVIEKLDNSNLDIEVIHIQEKIYFPNIDEVAGVIITGSHSMVTDEEHWSVAIEKWIPTLIQNDIPLLGICYGHQLLGKSLGGVSGYHKAGIEIGTVEINLCDEVKNDKLFKDMPTTFMAHTIHSQSVLELPSGSVLLAYNKHDKNHAFRVGKNAWGVQFHPEYNETIMKSYIKEVGKTKDINTDILIEKIKKTPYANLVLKRFGEIVEEEVKDD